MDFSFCERPLQVDSKQLLLWLHFHALVTYSLKATVSVHKFAFELNIDLVEN